MKQPQRGLVIHAESHATGLLGTTVVPKNGKEFTLQELQTFVGGNIERVVLKKGHGHATAYINEEGKLQGLPFNLVATRMCGLHGGDYIVGDMIVVYRRKEGTNENTTKKDA